MSYKAQSMTIATLVRDIDNYYLPAIQREFVWEPGKIEMLFDSLLREYPIGSFLLWEVRKPDIHEKFTFYDLIRDFDQRTPHNIRVDLGHKDRIMGVLDGQQRITSLLIGLQGSYREKLPKKRWDNKDAFPEKKLYMNLLYEPDPHDDDQQFQIKFLTKAQANHTESAYWFRLGKILPVANSKELRVLRIGLPVGNIARVEDNLNALWAGVHERDNISYFLETREDLDSVLSIFVRLNRGGTPLSYSDLLLSLATATWGTHDARQEVYSLVDYLNKSCGAQFNFSKDFVMKALLVLNDGDVRFKTENISKKNGLEKVWIPVQKSLKLTAKLLALFGFDANTLTTHNAAIPVAYYLCKRGLGERFLTNKAHEADREEIRRWLLKILLGRVFRGQTDSTLTLIRREIRVHLESDKNAGFPGERINNALRQRRGLSFTDEDVDRIVDETKYGDPYAFSILALLFPYLSFEHSRFHMDHMHPDSSFTRENLAKTKMSDEDLKFAMERNDYLPNLQLLTDAGNESKKNKPLEGWLSGEKNADYYRTTNLIPGVDLSLKSFRDFYQARRALLIQELKKRLGAGTAAAEPDEPVSADELVTGGDVDE